MLRSRLDGQSQLAGHAYIKINCVTNQTLTKMFQSCDIDKIMTRHGDYVFRFMIFAGMLHHSKMLCRELGISHLTYSRDDATTGMAEFISFLGFKRCVCTNTTNLLKCCIVIPSAQGLAHDVPTHALNDRAQGARSASANVMPGVSNEDDPSMRTSRLDTVDMLQKKPRLRDKKVYCTHWLSNGNCAYLQQGCIYRHEIPRDLQGWRSLGFQTIPGWLRAKSPAWIDQHLWKSPDLPKDSAVEESTLTRWSQPQVNPLRNFKDERSNRRPAHTKLRTDRDLGLSQNTRYPSFIDEPSSSDRRVSQRNKRFHQSSFSEVARKEARHDYDGWGRTRYSTAPKYQKDSFLGHTKRGAIESSRLPSVDSIDDPGCHARCGSRGYREDSYESSHQPLPQCSAASPDSTSGASYGEAYGKDPVLQASQFLGSWQVETPDVVWGAYPSHESYSPKRPHHLRDSYCPGKR